MGGEQRSSKAIEDQEDKIWELMKKFPKDSEEFKQAQKVLKWEDEDIEYLEELDKENQKLEQEKQAKYKRDWEKAMAQNERNSNPQTNKNHPYWNTPQGKAEANVNKWFDSQVVPERVPEFQRKEHINTMYAAMRKKALSLNSDVAAINHEIDRINNKRGKLTAEDKKIIKELRAKAQPLELEANAFVTKMNEWKNKYHPDEPELFQRYKIDPNTGKMTKITSNTTMGKSGVAPNKTRKFVPIGIINKFRGKYNGLNEPEQGLVKTLVKKAKENPESMQQVFKGLGNHGDIAMNIGEALKNKQITDTAARNVMAELSSTSKSPLLDALARDWLWQGKNGKNVSTNSSKNDTIKSDKNIVISAKSKAHGQGVRDALDRVLAHGHKTGNECLAWVDADGKQAFKDLYGTKNAVVFTRELDAKLKSLPPRSVDSVHNHPSGSALSAEDLSSMCAYESIDNMRVIGHNGMEYCVSIGTGQRPSKKDIARAYQKEMDALLPKYQDLVNRGMNPNQAWIQHSNEIVERLAQQYGWNYERRQP